MTRAALIALIGLGACATAGDRAGDEVADKAAACADAFERVANIALDELRREHADDPKGFERDALLERAEALKIEVAPEWRARCEREFPRELADCFRASSSPDEVAACEELHAEALEAAHPRADPALCERVFARLAAAWRGQAQAALGEDASPDAVRDALEAADQAAEQRRASFMGECARMPRDIAVCYADNDQEDWQRCGTR